MSIEQDSYFTFSVRAIPIPDFRIIPQYLHFLSTLFLPYANAALHLFIGYYAPTA